jgi:hypothetical protein
MGISIRSNNTGNASNASAVTINAPAGVQNNDVLLAFIVWDASAITGAWTGPTGWSSQTAVPYDSSNRKLQCWTKTAGSSEPGSYTWTNTVGSGAIAGTIVAMAGATTTGLVAGSGNSGNSATATANGVTTASNNSYIFACFADYGDPNITPQASMTGQGGAVQGGVVVAEEVASELIVTAGATGSRTATFDGSVQWGTQIIAIQPVPNVAGKEPKNIVYFPPPRQAHFE